MAEVKKVEAVTEKRPVTTYEDVEIRPAGRELFLTEDEFKGIRTFIGLGTNHETLERLGLVDLWDSIRDEIRPDYRVSFSEICKVTESC